MDTLLGPLVMGGASMGVALVGIIFTMRHAQKALHTLLHFLPSAAAGVFAVIIVSLLEESHEVLSPSLLALAVGGGLLAAGAVEALAPEGAECHGARCESRLPARVRRVMLADSLHNASDGIALVSAFSLSPQTGWAVGIGVLFHELVEELSEFFIYLEAGVPLRRALTYNVLSSSAVLGGIAVAALATAWFPLLTAALSAAAAGSFLFVVARDLLPHTFHRGDSRDLLLHLCATLAGAAAMYAITALIPEAHSVLDG